MIKYDVYKTPSPREEEPDHFHARAVSKGVITYAQLKTDLEYASSATPGDVSLIMDGIVSQIKRHLSEGESVQLGDLGTFSVGISGPNAIKRKAINATNLEVTDVYFRPRKKLIRDINRKAKFESTRLKHHSIEYSDIEIEALLTDFFKDHSFIARREFESLCGLTRPTAVRRLKMLCSGKYPLLSREGPRNSSIYFPTPGSFHTAHTRQISSDDIGEVDDSRFITR
ncbi:MAG: hypothetical protein GX416_11685 [Bacteroidales bacterium]|nr:hypothetical protein [Bacteroidales bacterium]